ncbi:phage virion morphogenesis protein [Campylobacter upsaliensis]|nr:phage virion morphogenesis protein [Campylobacter upsaliensis]
MRKSLFIILFILGANSAFACLCAGQISSSYSDFRTHISTKLKPATIKQKIKERKNREILKRDGELSNALNWQSEPTKIG